MTGFGRASKEDEGRQIVVELKSVNHRFLDLNFRMPRALGFLEDPLRRQIGGRLTRGHVDIFLSYRNTRKDAREVVLDQSLVEAYRAAFEEMARQSGLANDMALSHLAVMPDVLWVREGEEDTEAVDRLAGEAMDAALDGLLATRLSEGQRLQEDLRGRFEVMKQALATIRERAEGSAQQMKERLEKRVAELLRGVEMDPVRVAQEAALLADKAAIDEEIVRLGSHLEAAAQTLALDEPAGRKFDFWVQEMHREVNTMGSKSADMELTNQVLLLKGEIEKIREQVQNIE